MMRFFLLPFLVSAISIYVMLRWAGDATRWHRIAGVPSLQDAHQLPIPRLGWFGVALAALTGVTIVDYTVRTAGGPHLQVLVCALAAASIGALEDLTQRVSVRMRLCWVTAIALIATRIPSVVITHTDIAPLDWMITAVPFGAVLLTAFAITGLTNAFNIIDGLNGLASACGMIIFAAIGYAGFVVGDLWVAAMALVMVGAVAGFFLWNYPGGRIFLGDGGAYLCGFLVALLGLLLIARNPNEVSPLFPLLLCAYPVAETIFSMYRRARKRQSVGLPDRGHLHSLLYRRLKPRLLRRFDREEGCRRNAVTSPYLWALCLGSVLPALMFYDNTTGLGLSIALFVIVYVSFYRKIVRFRTPRWL